MAPFVPPEPPLTPDAPEPAPDLVTPLPPPEVGVGSPWAPADGENRDQILDWWRMWFRRVFFPWITAWTAYWAAQWARIIAYLNSWLNYAGEYIEDHAVNGHSWWKTDTPIDPNNPTIVEVIPFDEFRPILLGDLVSDTSINIAYGIVTELIDDTHARVTPLGQLRGPRGLVGFGWWPTVTDINHSGTTAVILTVDPTRDPQVGDFVVDDSETSSYGQVVTVTDATHVVVAYIGDLQGPPGIAAAGTYDLNLPILQPEGDAGDTYQAVMESLPQMIGAYVLTVTAPCWVRVYASEAYMLADQARDILTPLDIADDHGCYLDFVAIEEELSKTLTPGIMVTDIGLGVWLSVHNTDPTDPVESSLHIDYRLFKE